MACFNTRLLSILIYMVVLRFGYTQNASTTNCINAQPLCGSNQFFHPNTSGLNLAETGPNYGCLRARRNPSWFYFQIAEDGDLQFQIEQSTSQEGTPNLDVDFIVYGPFNDPRSPCILDLTASNTIDCSYASDFVEFADIQNAVSGDYYLLLITNFSGDPGFIRVSQTGGAASSNCVFLNDPTIIAFEACEGETLTLDATTNGAIKYVWSQSDGNGTFRVNNAINSAKHNTATSSIYRVDVYGNNNVLIKKFEFNTVFYQVPQVSKAISDYVVCDNFGDNDGIGEFDLRTKDLEILNGLNPANFLVSYYLNKEHASLGVEKLPNLYYNKAIKEEIYLRIDNMVPNVTSCYDIGKFNIAIIMLAEAKLDDEYILCVNTNGTEEIVTPPLIDTGLKTAQYNFTWRLNDVILPNETDGTLYPTDGGNYSVEVTDLYTGCVNYFSTMVIISSPPSIIASVTTLAFANTHRIEVTATGQGLEDFVFSLDQGPWQESGFFNDVSFGLHEIVAIDVNGCGSSFKNFMVIDYPHYFTPNGDGINDTWNIVGLSTQQNAKIFIFNRYGKLLKQVSSSGAGWDGNFNGSQMETDDYWFTIEYIEPNNGTINMFKAHFTLKR